MHTRKDKMILMVSEPYIASGHSLVPDKYMYPGNVILFVQIFPGKSSQKFQF